MGMARNMNREQRGRVGGNRPRCACPSSSPAWPHCCLGLPDTGRLAPSLLEDGVGDAHPDRQTDGVASTLVCLPGTPSYVYEGAQYVYEVGGTPPPGGGGTIPTPGVVKGVTPSLIFDPKSGTDPRKRGTSLPMAKDTPPKSLIRPLAGPINGAKPKDHLQAVRLDTRLQAARYLDEAVRVLVDTMRDPDNPKLRKEAALDLIQMVLGKPTKPPDEPKDKPQVLDIDDSTLEAILESDNQEKNQDD